MKITTSVRKLFLAIVTASLMTASYTAFAVEEKIIKIADFNTFLKAIGPNVTIVLVNNIEMQFGAQELETVRNSKYITTEKERYLPDWGRELTINNVSNFKIIGQGSSSQKIRITPKSTKTSVLTFSNSNNVTLQNLDIGHLKETASEVVLGFYGSSNILIKNSNIFGLGAVGLELAGVSDFSLEDSSLHNLGNRLAIIRNSKNIKFTSTNFNNSLNSEDAYGFNIINSSGVKFENSVFENMAQSKKAVSLFYLADGNSNIEIKNSRFLQNNITYFSNKSAQIGKEITVNGNDYQKNAFAAPLQNNILSEIGQKHNKYYVHNLSGVKLYKKIPLTKKAFDRGEIIPYKSEINFLRPEGAVVTRNNISGRWFFADFKGKKGYVFDGFLSHFPVKDATNKDLPSYHQKLTNSGIESVLEYEVRSGETVAADGSINCCERQGHSNLLKLSACNEKDAFWLFKSHRFLGDYAAFPDKDFVKDLIKTEKLSAINQKVTDYKWTYQRISENEIQATISDPAKQDSSWSQDFIISFNNAADITSFKFYFRNGEVTAVDMIAKKDSCLWQITESSFVE